MAIRDFDYIYLHIHKAVWKPNKASKKIKTDFMSCMHLWIHTQNLTKRNISHLQDLPCYELLTHFTLYTELNLVVPLTVWNTIPERSKQNMKRHFLNSWKSSDVFLISSTGLNSRKERDRERITSEKCKVWKRYLYLLADVFSTQHSSAGFALEAAEVPLATQS